MVEDRDKAEFIRGLMEDGCRYRGIHPEVKSQSIVSQLIDKQQTNDRRMTDNSVEAPVFQLEKKKVAEEDLDAKLDNLYR